MGAVNTNDDYRFDVQLSEGLVVEAWFYEMTRGGDRFEVKHDRKALETGNVYVEYAHDPGRRGEWRPCGIATSEADCWIFVLGDPPGAFVGVPADRLRALARQGHVAGRIREQPHGSCPTRAVVVNIQRLLGST